MCIRDSVHCVKKCIQLTEKKKKERRALVIRLRTKRSQVCSTLEITLHICVYSLCMKVVVFSFSSVVIVRFIFFNITVQFAMHEIHLVFSPYKRLGSFYFFQPVQTATTTTRYVWVYKEYNTVLYNAFNLENDVFLLFLFKTKCLPICGI